MATLDSGSFVFFISLSFRSFSIPLVKENGLAFVFSWASFCVSLEWDLLDRVLRLCLASGEGTKEVTSVAFHLSRWENAFQRSSSGSPGSPTLWLTALGVNILRLITLLCLCDSFSWALYCFKGWVVSNPAAMALMRFKGHPKTQSPVPWSEKVQP